MFAKNNDIGVGDSITLKGRELLITGFVALPDYSTLFERNTDSMFDSVNFSVAVMTKSGFDALGSRNMEYNYAWLYNEAPADDIEAAERSDKFLDVVKDELTDYDEAIVKAQVDELTDRLEKAGEEYGEIYKRSFEDKVSEITDNAEKGGQGIRRAVSEVYRSQTDRSVGEGAGRRSGVRADNDDHRREAVKKRPFSRRGRLHVLAHREYGERYAHRRQGGSSVPAGADRTLSRIR